MRIPAATLTLLLSASIAAAQSTTQPARPPTEAGAAGALKASPRHGEWVDINVAGGAKLHTWVVYPEVSGKAPVVLVIHEIFGMTDWVRATTDQLAAEGFIAVAPDLLSGKGPNGGNTDAFKSDDVRNAIQKLTPDEVTIRLDTARDFATKLPSASDKVGVVGFCWGGGQSFAYAAHDPTLKAAVVYYGTPPKDVSTIHAPILGNYGGDDARVTSTVEPTKAAMTDANKAYEPHVYEHAGHGFLRQQDGRDGANAKAATEAWSRTIAFLREKLGA